jgi:2-hydroxychromene-2-carboxylate isomerase
VRKTYSVLKACMGSIDAARRAGISPAAHRATASVAAFRAQCHADPDLARASFGIFGFSYFG